MTFTGSTATGRKVAATAGQALKKTVLELGGSDPYVVLHDADLTHAAKICVESRMTNTGQSCIAAKRFVVVSALRAEFEALVVERMKRFIVGDPTHAETEVGPMATVELRDELHRQVRQSIGRGATVLLGAERPEREGAGYPPTVLTNVRAGMPAYEEAIEIANDTRFGLAAAVFTSDIRSGENIARTSLQAGACFVNAAVCSDPRLPFGGIRDSGWGRELGRLGIREFVNAKTVYVASQ